MAQTQSYPLLLLLLLLFIALTSFSPLPSTKAKPLNPRMRALVSPITKDTSTSLYSISLNRQTSLVLDLTGPILWSLCPPNHPTFLCNTTTCAAAATVFQPPHCPRVKIVTNPCTCIAYPMNPVTRTCFFGDLTSTSIQISTTNGDHLTSSISISGVVSSCAPRTLLTSLPAAATGVVGLARSRLSLPSQLSKGRFNSNQFAICLPSATAAPGVAFFGAAPYRLLPPTLPEISTLLSYTALLKNPKNPAYFIDVEGIAVNREAVQFLARVLDFDSLGHGGVMLSTAVAYTTLRTHIYRPFLKAFAKATRGIPRVPRVKPFDLCVNSRALGVTRMGYGVPQIDLMLRGGKNWTFFGANSMKQVGPETACLAFVDGGAKAEQAAVIGGFQMEDNFLVFDVGRSTLGFTSTLFGVRTTCSNFNFTYGN
ncbi:chitinase CLP-like [Typha angustifolia]|uniref:chitinase CLP-like n=1 Tax=Typha angustifolia TaxID=59011 RepID=UPI003C2E73D8